MVSGCRLTATVVRPRGSGLRSSLLVAWSDPRLADVRPCARPGRKVHPPLQVRWPGDRLREGVQGGRPLVGCCPKDSSNNEGGEGELGLGGVRSSSRGGSSSSAEPSVSSGTPKLDSRPAMAPGRLWGNWWSVRATLRCCLRMRRWRRVRTSLGALCLAFHFSCNSEKDSVPRWGM